MLVIEFILCFIELSLLPVRLRIYTSVFLILPLLTLFDADLEIHRCLCRYILQGITTRGWTYDEILRTLDLLLKLFERDLIFLLL